MPERDAFGREIGENTLADMGWEQPKRTAPGPQWTKPGPSAFDAGEAWRLGGDKQKDAAAAPPAPAPRTRGATAKSGPATGASGPTGLSAGGPSGLNTGGPSGLGGPAMRAGGPRQAMS